MDSSDTRFIRIVSKVSTPVLSLSILAIVCLFIIQVYQGACLTLFGAMECASPSTQQPIAVQHQAVSAPVSIAFDVIVNEFEQEKRSRVGSYVAPVIELQDAIKAKDEQQITLAKAKINNNISRLSLDAYQADKSPFVPPKEKTQFLCDHNAFALIYHGLRGNSGTLVLFKLNGRHIGSGISPGYKGVHRAGYQELTLTYLEYSRTYDGPIIKYECGEV